MRMRLDARGLALTVALWAGLVQAFDFTPGPFELPAGEADAGAADGDADADGVNDVVDNCLGEANPRQQDRDRDGRGDACDSDRDGDGLNDEEELNRFGTSPDTKDTDADGVEDRRELLLGMSPADADSDDDGVRDADEPSFDKDTDGDGAVNAADPDSDGDGLFDGTELGLIDSDLRGATDTSVVHFVSDRDPTTKTDPLRADTDGGGECDGPRSVPGTCLTGEDANANGARDARERDPLDPLDDAPSGADLDGDGLRAGEEARAGTDPQRRDTDGDGLLDGREVKETHTDPLRADSDGDGVSDAEEVRRGTDPLQASVQNDDYSVVGGTWLGCSASPGRTRADGGLLSVLLLAGWLRVRRSSRTRGVAATLLLLLMAASRTAAAQSHGYGVNPFDVAERGSIWFAGDSLDIHGHVRTAVGLVGEWGYRPLVVTKRDDAYVTAVVRNQLVLHPGAAVVLWERVRLAVDLPVQAYADGGAVIVRGVAYAPPTDKLSLGDLRLAAAVRVLGERAAPIELAFGLQLALPTGDPDDYAGDGAVRVSPHAAIAGELAPFVYALRVGVTLRGADQPFFNTYVGHFAYVVASAGMRVLERKLVFGPELSLRSTLSHGEFGKQRATPVEALLGVRYVLREDLHIGAGIGFGLTAGLGAPAHRGLLSFTWTPPLGAAQTRSAP